MGSGASSRKTSPSPDLESQVDNRPEDDTRLSERMEMLEMALKQEEDVSDFSISEIAKCRLQYPNVESSIKTKEQLFSKEEQNKITILTENIFDLLKMMTSQLVLELTEGLEDDLSKARVIFLFLASIDVSKVSEPERRFGEEEESGALANGPLEYMLKIKQHKGNHAHLFCALCRVAGIPCEVIFGYNKSASYQLGKPVDKKKMAAQWNAIYVGGEWRLVDCFWSCSCIVGGDDDGEWDVLDVDGRIVAGRQISGNGKTTHRINEFFFLTDPEQLLATHIPKDNKWQLLPKNSLQTLEEFEEEVYRRERFFELGVTIPRKDLRKCKQVTEDGEVVIDLEIEEDSPSIDFKYMLFIAKSKEDIGNLEKFVMFQRGTGSVSYTARIPVKGTFKLDIFGRDNRKHNSLDLVCSYLIECGAGSSDKEPLPDDPVIGWGPDGGYLHAYEMEAESHKSGVIHTETGIVDIKFSLKQPLELMSLMLSNSHSKEVLSQYAYMEVKDGQCVIHITLPESGVYACELFANEEGIPGELQNVCNYVIKCKKKIKNEPMPYIPNGTVGAFSVAKELGVEIIDPLNPEIITEDGKVKIRVKVSEGIKLSTSLYHPKQALENSNKQISTSQDGGEVTIDLDLLLSGKQCLALYASKDGETELHNVFNYLIDNKAASKSKPAKSTDLPAIEKIHVKNGKAELTLPHAQAEDVLAAFSKEGAHLGEGSGQVTVKQDGVVSKITVKIPEDGVYQLDVYEKNESGESVLLKKRYQLIHEGGVPDVMEEPEEEQLPVVEEGEVEDEIPMIEEVADIESEEDKRHRELRQRLSAAIESGSEKELQSAIKDFKAAGNVADPNGLLERAERDLAIINSRKALKAAIESEDIKALQNALDQAQSIKHKGKLNGEIADAQRLLEKLRRIEKLRHAVLNLDQRTIAEIKSFATPPQAIETVMKGALLLLGSPKSEMKDWKSIVVLIGKTGKQSLKRRVHEFKVKELKPELAKEAKVILTKYSQEEVRDASSGAATFYRWGTGMIEMSEWK